MVFKLSVAETKEFSSLVETLRARQSALDSAIAKYNSKVLALYDKLNVEHVDPYSEAAVELAEFCANVVERFDDERESKSDRWHESDKGEAANAFVGLWADFQNNIYNCSELDLYAPEHLTPVYGIDLDALPPTSAEGV